MNGITALRILGAILLLCIKPLSGWFFIVYALCGISDALDGFLARRYHAVSPFGALFDSIADFTFLCVMLMRILPLLPWKLWILYWILLIVFIRLVTLTIGFIKYHTFAFLHTYANKVAGVSLFLFPFIYQFVPFTVAACIICSLAGISAFEELLITVKAKQLRPDVHSIFEK